MGPVIGPCIDAGRSYQAAARDARWNVQVPTGIYGAQFRDAAPALDRLIFGSAEIAALMNDASKSTLIYVPSGPLLGLPPGLLVTDGPRAGTGWPPPENTQWLLTKKAISILPSISSSRCCGRCATKAESAAPSDRLFAVADPDFSGHGWIGGRTTACRGHGGSTFPWPPPILGHRQIFGGRRTPCPARDRKPKIFASSLESRLAVLLGDRANERAVKMASEDGQMARVKIVLFATHAIVAGTPGPGSGPDWRLPRQAPQTRATTDCLRLQRSDNCILMPIWWYRRHAIPRRQTGPALKCLTGLARAFFYAGAHTRFSFRIGCYTGRYL